MSDVPSLTFVDPSETDARYRVVVFSAPGAGKTVQACSAPGPIAALSADRPGAYRYARRHHHGKRIIEARYEGSQSLREFYSYVRDNQADLATSVLDPFGAMYDDLVRENTGPSGKPNWQKVNDFFIDLLKAWRDLDVNLILVAHERREQDENGDTEAKVFPALGGPALVQKVMADMDIVTRVYRKDGEDGEDPVWMGQLATARGYQCKDSTNALGRVRPLDLSEWFSTASDYLGVSDSDLPWGDDGQQSLDTEEAA